MQDQMITRLLADLRPEDATDVQGVFPAETRARILAAIMAVRSGGTSEAEDVPARERRRLRTPAASRTASLRTRWAATSIGVAALGAGLILALTLGLSTGTPRAFAGWSASPTAPAGGQIASAEAACRAQQPDAASTESTSAGSPSAHSGWQVLLADTRGPYTMLIVRESGAVGSCLAGPSPSSTELALSVGGPVTPLHADQIAATASTRSSEGHPYTEIEGPAGSGVRGVTLLLSDGSHVEASVAGGWYVAWWPGSQHATAAEVSTTAGTATQTLGRSVRGG